MSNSSSFLGGRHARYGLATAYFVSLVLMAQTLRLVLFLQFARAGGAELWPVFRVGLQRDLFVASVLTLPLLFWFWVAPDRWFRAAWHRFLLSAALLVFWGVQVFLACAEFYFFEEFRSRFNTVAVDYLLYPHEVFINIWDSYPVAWVVGGCALLAALWLVVVLRGFRGMWEQSPGRWARVGAFLAALALTIGLGRSISLKELQISHERVLNEIANNGPLSFAAAFWTRDLDFSQFYRVLPRDEAYRRVRRLLSEPNTTLAPQPDSIQRKVAGDSSRPRLNLVLILEESLGSEFWGSLGRREASLTPEMERLAAQEGMLFTNIYASGNRTVRGFEGVLSSFPPLPGDAIVKRDRSQNVETVARVLKRDGYSTSFIYGGRGVFDSMRSFALNNGYDRFVEQKHFEHPTHKTIWGVCDEDILMRTVEECRHSAKTGAPFFTTVLTVSNHKPYTYPNGRIVEDPDARKRSHAVKYADYALGKFFQAARQESFWTNTVFVIVADHGARVYGSEKIPIHSYEIPLLVVGPAVVQKPTRPGALGCSLDVAPTILGLIGRPYDSLFFGRDLLQGNPEHERVLINHNRDIGIYARERLVVLGLKKTVEYYSGDPREGDLKRVTDPTALEREVEADATALFQVADELYTQRRYRLDTGTQLSSRGSETARR